jgi:hypothetical protein
MFRLARGIPDAPCDQAQKHRKISGTSQDCPGKASVEIGGEELRLWLLRFYIGRRSVAMAGMLSRVPVVRYPADGWAAESEAEAKGWSGR